MTDHAFHEGVAREMLSKFNRLRSFTGHQPSVGDCHEEILRETLRSRLSQRFQLQRGFSFASKGNVSAQGDILIIDGMDPDPYHLREGGVVVVRPRALACVIQVKTTLTKRTFAEAIDNLASFGRVADEAAPGRPPATFVFAFRSPHFRTEMLDRWYRSIVVPNELSSYPIAVFSLQRGILRRRCESRRRFGHHYIGGEDGEGPHAKALAIFLASIWKQLDMRAGVESNPYQEAPLDGLRWSPDRFRYGTGLVTMR